MQFTVYKSTDGSAPILSGTTGSLVALLDACLVNGYTGKAAAGWGKTFTGTSKAVYRAPSGVRHYLRVQDDGPGAGTFREARLTGYATMTDVDTGVGPFPTAAQGVGGVAMLVARKSTTADATARAWVVLADARTVYVLVLTGDTAGTYMCFAFGEYYSILNPASTGRTFLIGRIAENVATLTSEKLDVQQAVNVATTGGQYTVTTYAGTGSSTVVSKDIGDGNTATSAAIAGIIPYPNPTDNALHLSPVWLHEPNNRIGRMRGMWCVQHPIASFTDGQTFSGAGSLAAKTFLILKQGGNAGLYCFETSDTLETN